jgi:HAD superfamily hydrolase (TIGR01509 family)
MLQAVIFDMDGVIIDSHPAHRKAWHAFLKTLGRTISDAELDFVLDGRKRDEILRHFLGQLSEDAIREHGNRKDAFFRESSLEVSPIPGVLDLLGQLHTAGIVAGIATSASESRTRHTLERLNLLDKFAAIVTGNDVDVGKPDPAVYQLACQRLNVPTGRALAIEDAVSGIQAAKSAGLACIGVAGHQSPQKLRKAGAARVVMNLVGLSPGKLDHLLEQHSRRAAPAPTAD